MRPLFYLTIVICALAMASNGFAQTDPKQESKPAGSPPPGLNIKPTIGSNADKGLAPATPPPQKSATKPADANSQQTPAGQQSKTTGNPPPGLNLTATIGSNADTSGMANSNVFGKSNRPKGKSTEEQLADAKKKYMDVFPKKKSFEVRLRNKSLALKRGKFIRLAGGNEYALFESTRMVVAVPADKLAKRLEQKVADQLEKAKAILTETGIACDEVFEIPEGFEKKMVGLAGREKIEMFFIKKEKDDKKKSSKKASGAAEDEKVDTKDNGTKG